jgi:hypothetical protein
MEISPPENWSSSDTNKLAPGCAQLQHTWRFAQIRTINHRPRNARKGNTQPITGQHRKGGNKHYKKPPITEANNKIIKIKRSEK